MQAAARRVDAQLLKLAHPRLELFRPLLLALA
jgi:hypothetical protein